MDKDKKNAMTVAVKLKKKIKKNTVITGLIQHVKVLLCYMLTAINVDYRIYRILHNQI